MYNKSRYWHILLYSITGWIGLVWLFFRPLLQNLSTHTPSVQDGALIIWLTHQSAAALAHHGSWYNWPFFYPYLNTATFSDPFVSSGAVLLVIQSFISQPIAQYNILLLVSLLGNFWALYALAQALWHKPWVSWLSATVFAFSFTQYQFLPHLHTYWVWGIPLGLWGVLRYRETSHWWWILVVWSSFLVQACNAPLTAYFFLACLGIFIVTQRYWELLRDHYFLTGAAMALGVCGWFYLPYWITAAEFHAARTIRDTAHFSYGVEKLLSPEIVLSVFVIGWGWLKSRRLAIHSSALGMTIWSLIVVGAACMLGPVVKWQEQTVKIWDWPIPLPYAILYYIIPGIQAFRSVSRWAVVLNLGLALGWGWASYKLRSKWLVAGLFITYLALTYQLVQQQYYLYPASSAIPPIYHQVAVNSGSVLAEFPLYQWNMGEMAGAENQRLLYQLYHQKLLFNGVSGITPPARAQEIEYYTKQFPAPAVLEKLKQTGVTVVLVHLDEYQQLHDLNMLPPESPITSAPSLAQQLQQSSQLHLIACTPQPWDCLYSFAK